VRPQLPLHLCTLPVHHHTVSTATPPRWMPFPRCSTVHCLPRRTTYDGTATALRAVPRYTTCSLPPRPLRTFSTVVDVSCCSVHRFYRCYYGLFVSDYRISFVSRIYLLITHLFHSFTVAFRHYRLHDYRCTILPPPFVLFRCLRCDTTTHLRRVLFYADSCIPPPPAAFRYLTTCLFCISLPKVPPCRCVVRYHSLPCICYITTDTYHRIPIRYIPTRCRVLSRCRYDYMPFITFVHSTTITTVFHVTTGTVVTFHSTFISDTSVLLFCYRFLTVVLPFLPRFYLSAFLTFCSYHHNTLLLHFATPPLRLHLPDYVRSTSLLPVVTDSPFYRYVLPTNPFLPDVPAFTTPPTVTVHRCYKITLFDAVFRSLPRFTTTMIGLHFYRLFILLHLRYRVNLPVHRLPFSTWRSPGVYREFIVTDVCSSTVVSTLCSTRYHRHRAVGRALQRCSIYHHLSFDTCLLFVTDFYRSLLFTC